MQIAPKYHVYPIRSLSYEKAISLLSAPQAGEGVFVIESFLSSQKQQMFLALPSFYHYSDKSQYVNWSFLRNTKREKVRGVAVYSFFEITFKVT